MNANYSIKQANSSYGDTVFIVSNVHKSTKFMFDCGNTGSVPVGALMGVSHIFISHTHMDHFYGFDRLLRSLLISDKTIYIYGPKGLINNIYGKLSGYTWNLVDNYKFQIVITELTESNRASAKLSACNKFKIEPIEPLDNQIGDGFTFSYQLFDHGTTSIGYRINEKPTVSILPEEVSNSGYVKGKWLSLLKNAVENGNLDLELEIETVDGSTIRKKISELEYLYTPYHAQSITFLTDIAPKDENKIKAIDLAKDSDVLLIESMFLDEDIDHAIAKNHLTVGISKSIFLASNAKLVRFFHFSSRYTICKESFLKALLEDIEDSIYQL